MGRALPFLLCAAGLVVGSSASGLEPAVAIATGVVNHGAQIPLPVYPDGTTADPTDCAWAVYPRTVNSAHGRVYGFTHQADQNRIAFLRQITLNGTFHDLTGHYIIIAVRGHGGAELAFATGQAHHGDTLPLPVYADGTTASASDCKWVVTPAAVPTGYNALLGLNCSASANRVVTMIHVSTDGTFYEAWANYIVVAVRPDPSWQVAVKAEARWHGEVVTFPPLPEEGAVASAGIFTGPRSFASGHDAMLGYAVRVQPDMSQYVRQTTIDGGGSDFYDSVATTLTLVSGPLAPVSVDATSWAKTKAAYR